MTRVTLCGAGGRMGVELHRAIREAADLSLVLAVEHADHLFANAETMGVPFTADLSADYRDCDVVIDFSEAPAVADHLRVAREKRTAYVTGVTGLSDEVHTQMRGASEDIAVLFAPNMSRGIAVLSDLVRRATERLGGYDIEIVEMHHRRKRDAPSGTALQLAAAADAARGDLARVHGREGMTGVRPQNQIGIHALRGGDVVGEHHVIFAGTGERLVLTHRVESRQAFVSGALAAARFVVGQPPGVYRMEDVLGM